ncbi:hypothetical protein MMB17_05715 [Methylobacterium organophilum]|uniref:hypothetical protein n=1 Tax=Methylobacterium organophilum TaxID=410 RepID=UPI001F13DDBE|nr:hypothetical protein [Methylobacterium organophilum]UMY18813.1 hypothetical protein MMB17_05715 [Methylobacterium organophilum]
MRSQLVLIAVLAAGPALARGVPWPADGVYCGPADTMAIVVDGGGIGVDGLGCRGGRIRRGRYVAELCYANGGSTVAYDTDLRLRRDGTLLHDGGIYRRRDRGPCP